MPGYLARGSVERMPLIDAGARQQVLHPGCGCPGYGIAVVILKLGQQSAHHVMGRSGGFPAG